MRITKAGGVFQTFLNSEGKKFIVDMGAISRNAELIASKRTDSSADLLEINDLVMPKDDIGGGNIIGKVAIIDASDKYICGDHVYRLVQKGNDDIRFLRFLINSPPMNRRLRVCANGTSQIGLRRHDIIRQQIRLPDISEQRQTALILDTARKEIQLLKNLTNHHRLQKRGLMQKLLTGQWRLNS